MRDLDVQHGHDAQLLVPALVILIEPRRPLTPSRVGDGLLVRLADGLGHDQEPPGEVPVPFEGQRDLVLVVLPPRRGFGNSLFWPTAQAFVQELVSEEDYFNANKLLSASYQVGSIIGAGIGGFIVHLYDPIMALWINVLSYLISGILISLAPFQKEKQKTDEQSLLSAISDGFTFLKGKFDILTLGLTTILSDVAIWGSLSVLTISISKVVFNKGSWGYGLMEGLYGFGALVSTIFVGYVVEKVGRGHSLILCYLMAGSMCFIVPIMPSIYFAAIAFLFMGLHNNSARIIVRTIFMEKIPNRLMGRVQTIFGVYTRLMVVLSSLFSGWIIENHSIIDAVNFTTLHFFFALLGIIIVIYAWGKSKNILRGNLT